MNALYSTNTKELAQREQNTSLSLYDSWLPKAAKKQNWKEAAAAQRI